MDVKGKASAETDRLVADFKRTRTELRPGTLLTREWEGHLQRVMVQAGHISYGKRTVGPTFGQSVIAITEADPVIRHCYGAPTGSIIGRREHHYGECFGADWHFNALTSTTSRSPTTAASCSSRGARSAAALHPVYQQYRRLHRQIMIYQIVSLVAIIAAAAAQQFLGALVIGALSIAFYVPGCGAWYAACRPRPSGWRGRRA